MANENFFINAALIVVRVSANRISSCLGPGCAFIVGALPNEKSFLLFKCKKISGKDL